MMSFSPIYKYPKIDFALGIFDNCALLKINSNACDCPSKKNNLIPFL